MIQSVLCMKYILTMQFMYMIPLLLAVDIITPTGTFTPLSVERQDILRRTPVTLIVNIVPNTSLQRMELL